MNDEDDHLVVVLDLKIEVKCLAASELVRVSRLQNPHNYPVVLILS